MRHSTFRPSIAESVWPHLRRNLCAVHTIICWNRPTLSDLTSFQSVPTLPPNFSYKTPWPTMLTRSLGRLESGVDDISVRMLTKYLVSQPSTTPLHHTPAQEITTQGLIKVQQHIWNQLRRYGRLWNTIPWPEGEVKSCEKLWVRIRDFRPVVMSSGTTSSLVSSTRLPNILSLLRKNRLDPLENGRTSLLNKFSGTQFASKDQ
ncbi:hypothetical protein C8J56DRAFT_993918 [Mycena floridula]|nr:hypothetical protein C8J56DRAFT_993918 [Mycena floridula]